MRFCRCKRRFWMCSFIEFWLMFKCLLVYGLLWCKLLVIVVVMMWIVVVVEVSGLLFISYFIDNMVVKYMLLLKLVVGLVVVYIGLQLLVVFLYYNQLLLFNCVVVGVVQQLCSDVMDVVLYQLFSEFDIQLVGQFILWVINDMEVICDLYVMVVVMVLCSVVLIGVMLVVMFSFDWWMVLVVIVIFLVVLIVMIIYQCYSMLIVWWVCVWFVDINDGFNEVINGMGVIQQFCQQVCFGEWMCEVSYVYYLVWMQMLCLDGFLLCLLLSFFFLLVLCGLLMLFGFSVVGMIEVGVLYVFISYFGCFNELFIELIIQQLMLQQVVVVGECVFELMDCLCQVWGMDDVLLSSGWVEIDYFFFVYWGDCLVFQDIMLDIFFCSFVVLVGYIGSGKSIFVSLMMGYYLLIYGEICIDG